MGVAVAATAVAGASLFAPWHRSGRRVRSGVELISVAEQLGLLGGTGWGLLRAGATLLPLLAAGAVAAALLGRSTIALVLTATAGSVAVVVGAVAHGLPGARWGSLVTVTAGAAAVLATATAVVLGTRGANTP